MKSEGLIDKTMKSKELMDKIIKYHRHIKGGFYEAHHFLKDYEGCTDKCDKILKQLENEKLKEILREA